MTTPPTLVESLATLLPDFVARQRWFAGDNVADLEILETVELREGWPALVWVRFRVGGVSYQELVGLRRLEQTERFLEGKGRVYLGDIETDDGPALAYGALVDPELAMQFAALVVPDQETTRMRPLTAEQSNTSVVFDDRLIVKLYRRVADGPNPDVEVLSALADVGFKNVPTPRGVWRRDGRDLAIASDFLEGGNDGWSLALTSLRDIYDSRLDPAEAGGDFGPEARRLGALTAELHLALADALGSEAADVAAWEASLRDALVGASGFDIDAVASAYGQLSAVTDAGRAIRIHGDYHLGQVLRTDDGWYVLDFEGEPLVPVTERRQRSAPLRDVAGMLRSFHYATEVARAERGHDVEGDDDLGVLAAKWEARAADSFLDGYFGVDGVDALLPPSAADRQAVLDAFVLAKAVYEVGYEQAHRPDWTHIPAAAIERILG